MKSRWKYGKWRKQVAGEGDREEDGNASLVCTHSGKDAEYCQIIKKDFWML